MKLNRKITVIKGEGTPLYAQKLNRNSPCTCGSGKKQKNCCGVETKYKFEQKIPVNNER